MNNRILSLLCLTLLSTGFFTSLTQAQSSNHNYDLSWMNGSRVHTAENGSRIYEAFTGGMNGIVTGTALSVGPGDAVFREYHYIGPNEAGRYGLSVANTGGGLEWNFMGFKSYETGRITFESDNGQRTVAYFAKPGGAVGAMVQSTADGQVTTREWDFQPIE